MCLFYFCFAVAGANTSVATPYIQPCEHLGLYVLRATKSWNVRNKYIKLYSQITFWIIY
jgi:hypothetical protein